MEGRKKKEEKENRKKYLLRSTFTFACICKSKEISTGPGT